MTGDTSTGNGLTSTATFTTPAAGLPTDNSAFGAKTVSLSIIGAGEMDTATVEIFYPRDSSNHAGGQGGSPNWYHYWSQTSADYGTHTWVAGGGTGYTNFVDGEWQAFIQNAQGHTAGGTWDDAEGIDLFANLVRHEEQHRLDLIALWGAASGRVGAADLDGDYLPDADEGGLVAGRPYDPTDPATYPDTFNYLAAPGDLRDVEDYALRRQAAWTTGSADAEDWANPGMQHATNGDADD